MGSAALLYRRPTDLTGLPQAVAVLGRRPRRRRPVRRETLLARREAVCGGGWGVSRPPDTVPSGCASLPGPSRRGTVRAT